jgi:putative oxidoreductase
LNAFLTNYSYALMRIVFGAMFMTYGLQKLGLLGGPMRTAPLLLAAAIIELVAGLLIALGLFTRVTALVASGEMAVAYFRSHQPSALLPVQNGGIPAVLFCFAFLFIAAYGAGRLSLDGRRVLTFRR